MKKNNNEIDILIESKEALEIMMNNFDNKEEALLKLIEILKNKSKGNLDETFFVPYQEG